VHRRINAAPEGDLSVPARSGNVNGCPSPLSAIFPPLLQISSPCRSGRVFILLSMQSGDRLVVIADRTLSGFTFVQ
jgi:hypothetical protein